MALKPWYTVIPPREDLRSGRPLDAAEFAVHLDKVRDGKAADVYNDPEQFFARTYLTQTLLGLSGEVVRRLSGELTEASAVFNLSTQFGGGKTHALTLLYHLAKHGRDAEQWQGVPRILERARLPRIFDKAAVAVFVGTEFDSLTGRGGNDGTPRRRTPWGEIAYQLGETSGIGGAANLALLAEHEEQFIEPKGDVIRSIIPKDRPCLILMDEIINYVSTYRRKGYGDSLYNFMLALSETARSEKNVVLVVSIPASELEYTTADVEDERRFKKVLDRLGKAYMMSAESETAEIIRRRLFEWDLRAIGQNGRIALPREAGETCNAYAQWVQTHRQSLPPLFQVDDAREAFAATYPFHPMVLSVFERKWQSLPQFQRTRGVLRLLAHWVSSAYREGYTGAFRDPLIDLGTAPLDDPLFRAAVFEQLGEEKLEVPVTTDICGQKDSHAVRLDADAIDSIRKARLHRKVASAIFFESNGGQSQNQATLPELRMAVAAPDLDIANVETVMEALVPPNGACYYLDTNKNRYWFSIKPNLTKILADRKAGVQPQRIDERVRAEIEKAFAPMSGVDRVFFPVASGQISNQPVITLVVMAPDQLANDSSTLSQVDKMTRENGGGGRTFKSALIWVLSQGDATMREEARKVLAWETINDERDDLALDDGQKKQIESSLRRAREDFRESVWRAYNHLAMLGKDNTIQVRNLGLINSSSGANSPVQLIVQKLRVEDEILDAIGPNFLVRNWPAFPEWSTKSVRDAFFASPKFPRLLSVNALKETIAKGVSNGFLAYVGKAADGSYQPFAFQEPLQASDVELTEDMYIITKETAEAYKRSREEAKRIKQNGEEYITGGNSGAATQSGSTATDGGTTAISGSSTAKGGTSALPFGDEQATEDEPAQHIGKQAATALRRMSWTGEVPHLKWMNLYTKVLSRLTKLDGLKLTLRIDLTPGTPLTQQQLDEIRLGLKELGLSDDVRTEDQP